MKITASLLTAAVLLASTPAHAEPAAPRGRGWLTGAGLGFTALALAGVGVGVGGLLQVGDANTLLTAYVGTSGVPASQDLQTVRDLQTRADSGQTLATVGFILAGVGAVGAITCLVLDGIWADRPVEVSWAPMAGGGALLLGGRF